MMGQDSQAPSTQGIIQAAAETVTTQQQQPPPPPHPLQQQEEAASVVGVGGLLPPPFPLQQPPDGRGGAGGVVMMGRSADREQVLATTTIRGTFEVTPARLSTPLVPPPMPGELLFAPPGLGLRGSISAPMSPQGHPPQGYSPSSSFSSSSHFGPRASSVPIPQTAEAASTTTDPLPAFSSHGTRQQSAQSRPHIPNIVIEQVSARDSFGHSRTPPFVLSQFSPWQLDIPGGGRGGNNGRKNRTNSDSALYDVEKEQQQQQRRTSQTTRATVRAMLPVLSPSLSSERLHLEHIKIADSPTKDSHATYQFFPSSHHFNPVHSTTFPPRNPLPRAEAEAQGVARQISQGFVFEEQWESAMETECSAAPELKSEVRDDDVALDLQYSSQPSSTAEQERRDRVKRESETTTTTSREMESETVRERESETVRERESETSGKPKVPFLWKFQSEKQSLSQSPKTFWLRRHSDSNLPTHPQNLTVTHEQQRSHSTGESHEPSLQCHQHHHRGDETGETRYSGAEAHQQRAARESTGGGGESFRSSLSESREAPDHRTDPNWSAKRMKLKKTLLKRYQLQSEESPGSAQHSLESDDVFSPSPGVFSARAFSFSPERIHSLQEAERSPASSSSPLVSQREAKGFFHAASSGGATSTSTSSLPGSSACQKHLDLAGTSTSGEGDPSSESKHSPRPVTPSPPQPAYVFSGVAAAVASKAVGKAGKPVRPLYVKTDTISSSSSGDQEEGATETPVFFSPSMFSPRSYYDSPRQSGSVFQFHSPSHSRSPSLEKSDTPSPPRASTCSPFLHSPSPLSQDPQHPRPPFHRSPSPLSHEMPVAATQGPTSTSSQVTKKAALVRDISVYGGEPMMEAVVSSSKQPRVLPHSPRESQSPIGPYIMPTIKEHSQPQGGSSTTSAAALGAFPPGVGSDTLAASSRQQQPLSSSAPAGFLSQAFHQVTQREQHQQHQHQYQQGMRSPQGMMMEAMLRHPSFTLPSASGFSTATVPKHVTLSPGDRMTSPAALPRDSEQTTTSPFVLVELNPVPQSALIGSSNGGGGGGGGHLTPFQSYTGELSSSSPSSKSMVPHAHESSAASLHWRSAAPHGKGEPSAAATLTSSASSTGGSSKKSPSLVDSSGKPLDASKIIYCPFSEKVQEQRYQQDPHHQNFVCPVCGQMFPSFNYLANHMVNHLPSETITRGPGEGNKIHLCKVCNKCFSRSDMLTRHMRLHTGLRPYECRICGQVFSRSDHLHTHMRTHTGEKPYRCPQCPYAAPRRDMITRHMRIHMKQKRSGGRRNSSTGSADTQQSSFSSQESADSEHHQKQQRRKNPQSLSSLESMSLDSPLEAPPRRIGSSASSSGDVPQSPTAEYEAVATRRRPRHWSMESGASSDVLPSPSTPASLGGSFALHQWEVVPKKRSWSATSMEVDDPPPPFSETEERGGGGWQHYWEEETQQQDTELTIRGRPRSSFSAEEAKDTTGSVSSSISSTAVLSSETKTSREIASHSDSRRLGDVLQQHHATLPGEYQISMVKTEPATSDLIEQKSSSISSGGTGTTSSSIRSHRQRSEQETVGTLLLLGNQPPLGPSTLTSQPVAGVSSGSREEEGEEGKDAPRERESSAETEKAEKT